MFFLPVLCAAFGCIPFLYLSGILSAYEKQLDDEMETTLSAVTNSYLRSEDIIGTVRENLKYIKPPLYSVFKSFLDETESISANTKSTLLNMADKMPDGIFREWVEALVRCQDDRTLKDTLQPIVSKLSDVRTVNTELAGVLRDAKNVNTDGLRNAADLTMLRRTLLDIDTVGTADFARYDIKEDSKIDLIDLVRLKKILAGY